jgi:threonine dehydrogenase-like Zn-dependent dehydrogenase
MPIAAGPLLDRLPSAGGSSHLLQEHVVERQADVVVIGAGVVGMATTRSAFAPVA